MLPVWSATHPPPLCFSVEIKDQKAGFWRQALTIVSKYGCNFCGACKNVAKLSRPPVEGDLPVTCPNLVRVAKLANILLVVVAIRVLLGAASKVSPAEQQQQG
jgi:hypothetical protein